MDKVISEAVTSRKRRKAILYTVLSIGVFALATVSLRYAFKSSLKRSQITTAVVEVGNIENTINASGEILPEFEQLITSPIDASIQEVLLDPGSAVKQGESILLLDKSATQAMYQKLKFQLESKQNEIQKLKLELDKSFSDIQSNNDIKQLRTNSLAAALEDAKRLYKAGGGTKSDIEQAQLNLEVAQLEKKQLENEIKSKQQTMRIEMRESQIAAAIQENELSELQKKLDLASVVATRPGVVIWVNKNIGANIRQGESLARIANLESFKVSGTITDSYLNELKNGMAAIVRINESQFRGSVTNINPSVQNGVISFDVQLDERNDQLFRPNMKVDIFLVTSTRTNVLKVANGPAFRGAATQDIFVLQNDGKAIRRTVHTGASNFDFVELKDNVQKGETIITSDMSEYKNAREILISN